MGSNQNIAGISSHATDIFSGISQLFIGVRLFVYMWDYLFIASFFVLLLLIFYLIILYTNKKLVYDKPFSIVIIFWLASTIMTIGSTIIFIFASGETALILGRYVEPVVPFMIILGIIGLTNVERSLISRKMILGFAIFSFATILFVVYTMVSDNAIINQMYNSINHPTMTAFIAFYGPGFIEAATHPSMHVIPAILIVCFFLIVSAMMTLSIYDKRYLNFFLLFLIISSIAGFATIYNYDVGSSKALLATQRYRHVPDGTYKPEHYAIRGFDEQFC